MLSNINEKNLPMAGLHLGDIIMLEIDGYTHDGQGVGRMNGAVVFVRGALQGELVQAEIKRERRGVFYADLLAVLQASGQRQEPDCPVYASCGGCHLQHMSYAEELNFKQQQVQAALQRLAGLQVECRPPLPAEQIYHYRNKGVFHVSRQESRLQLGFWDEASHQPAGAACQLLFPLPLNELVAHLQQTGLPLCVSDVLLRFSFAEEKIMLFLRIQPGSSKKALAEASLCLQQISRNFANLAVWGLQTDTGWQTLSAEKYLTDTLADVRYQIAPEAFFQVNNAQTLRLLQVIEQALPPDTEQLLDAYCGIGTLGLAFAKHLPGLRRLLGIELNRGAVASARQNARLNDLVQAEFWLGKAEQEFAKVLRQGFVPDAVIVDPPRRGCHQQLLNGLLQLAPRQLIYVSCNPATLARDLRLLCAEKYAVQLVQPVDMFPRTHHVETVVLLSKG